MKQVRWVSQAVMYGDRRPYPVMLITLAEEEIGAWARERGLPEDVATLSPHPDVEHSSPPSSSAPTRATPASSR